MASIQTRTAESFGAVAVGFPPLPTPQVPTPPPGPTPIDNRAALQAAIDWCNSTATQGPDETPGQGGQVIFAAGVYGFSGTLVAKSYMNFKGVGGKNANTVLQQMDTTWPDCIASAPGTTAFTGASDVKLEGFMLDGGWDLKNSAGTGTNWDYLLDSKTQRGIYLATSNGGADRLNRYRRADAHTHISDVWVRRVAGTGIVAEGRGEWMVHQVVVSECAVNGLELDCVDNWLLDFTAYTMGNSGLYISAGNQRVSNVKMWFCGMCKGEQPVGAGLQIVGAGVSNIVGSNVTTQDTWGPGMVIDGRGHLIFGQIDNAGGGRLEQQSLGFAGTRTLPRHAVQINAMQDARLDVAISGANLSLPGLPAAVYFQNTAADANVIRTTYQKHISPTYLASPKVIAVAGMVTQKRHNIVYGCNDELLYGTRTLAELGDAAHKVNIYKGPGQVVHYFVPGSSTGAQAIAISTGDTATSPWTKADGSDLVTPSS